MRVLAIFTALAVAACGGGDPGEARTAPEPSATAPGRAFESLEEAAAALGCSDTLQDVGTGGNPGLTEFGVCYVGRDNVDIYMTSERALWESLADQFPSVLGPNWIVVCPTGPAAARTVHDRLGGELVIPKSPKGPS